MQALSGTWTAVKQTLGMIKTTDIIDILLVAVAFYSRECHRTVDGQR